MIRTRCPHCQEPVKAPDSLAGKKGRCPECRGVIPLPIDKSEIESAASIQHSANAQAGLAPGRLAVRQRSEHKVCA